MRLLPENSRVRWVPYLCLLPILFVPLDAYFADTSTTEWIVTGLALGIFVPMYFWSFWLRGWVAAVPIGCMASLGFLMAPFNSNASVFILYASGLIGFLGTARRSVVALAILIGGVALQSRLLGFSVGYWAPTVVLAVVFGGFCISWMETDRTNARLHLKQEEIERLAKTAERERIARDLHDLLGHTLSLSVLKARLANKLIGKDSERARQEIAEIEQISHDALQEVRDAVRGYRTVGFGGELENARLALEAADITSEFTTSDLDLDPVSDSILAMTLREAITNVVRHSGATYCHVALNESGSTTNLSVSDNGRGGVFVEGSGLNGMRERLIASGGELGIDSTDGMAISASLPRSST